MYGQYWIGKPITYTAPDTEYKYKGTVLSFSGAGVWVEFSREDRNVFFTWNEVNKFFS